MAHVGCCAVIADRTLGREVSTNPLSDSMLIMVMGTANYEIEAKRKKKKDQINIPKKMLV